MLTQKVAGEKLNELLTQWSKNEFKNFPELIGVLQFGSTTKSPLKYETDLDLLLIFEKLPKSRWDQFKLTEALESKMNLDLKQLEGFNIQTSFILKEKASLDHLSPFYLDFPDHSKIWYDLNGVLVELLENIKKWIAFNGSYRVQKGNLWYWVYDKKNDPKIPVSFKFIKDK